MGGGGASLVRSWPSPHPLLLSFELSWLSFQQTVFRLKTTYSTKTKTTCPNWVCLNEDLTQIFSASSKLKWKCGPKQLLTAYNSSSELPMVERKDMNGWTHSRSWRLQFTCKAPANSRTPSALISFPLRLHNIREQQRRKGIHIYPWMYRKLAHPQK